MQTRETHLITDVTPLVHRVSEPKGPGPHRTVVMVQGRGGDEDVMWVFARALPLDWLVVAPRAPISDMDGYSWHPPRGEGWPVFSDFEEAAAILAQFIQTLPGLYNADPEEIYMMGFSQGAAASLITAIHHPNLVQGIACLVGFLPDETPPDLAANLQDLPLFMAVGKEDDTIPLELAQQSGKQLRRAGAQLTYREYDTGHKLNASGMRDLKAWWQQFQK